jgi:CHRD domain
MSNFHSKIIATTIIASVIAALSTFPILAYAQQQTNFAANLSGKNIVPPTNSTATGTATFSVNPNGNMSYQVDAMNINKVIGVPVSLKNGTELAELLNLYATTGGGNRQQSAIPTGPVNGPLTSGVITADKLDGPLFGKSVTDLVNLIKSGSAYVTVRTTPNQHGEIRGQIIPSSAAPITAAAPSTAAVPAPAPVMNKTAGTNVTSTSAAPVMNKTAGMAAPTTTAAAPTTAAVPAPAPVMNKTAGTNVTSTTAASAVQRGCVGNAVTTWTLNSTTTHKELVDKIAGCFNQK